MKMTIIGGGPGGLFAALLCKKAKPDWDIEIFERNKADDTFGFGVVFAFLQGSLSFSHFLQWASTSKDAYCIS